MPSLAEFEQALGLEAGTLTSKPNAENTFKGYFAEADTRSAEAERKLREAQTLQATIDDQIAQFGITESTVNNLQATVAALKAAKETLDKNGVKLDLNIPEVTPKADPDQQFRQNVINGFTQIGQTMAVQNRYFQVFGKPMPDDPVKLADEAASARMSVADYAEKKYGFAAEQQRKADAELQAKIDAGIQAGVKKYQEEHPTPQFGEAPGMPSNFPKMPAPRDAKDLRSFAGLTAREKIADAMSRANQAAKSAA